jgi:hypothetical protein
MLPEAVSEKVAAREVETAPRVRSNHMHRAETPKPHRVSPPLENAAFTI